MPKTQFTVLLILSTFVSWKRLVVCIGGVEDVRGFGGAPHVFGFLVWLSPLFAGSTVPGCVGMHVRLSACSLLKRVSAIKIMGLILADRDKKNEMEKTILGGLSIKSPEMYVTLYHCCILYFYVLI